MTTLKTNDVELPMPIEKLPDCWHDHARMNALYAPLRHRTVNPQDWESKLVFWKGVIMKWSQHHQHGSFTLADLNKAFKRDGRAPDCLQIILEEMYRQENLQTLARFMQTPQETWTGWAMDILVKRPFIWSYNKMKEKVVSPIDSNTIFVDLNVIESISNTLVGAIDEAYYNKVIDTKELMNIVNGYKISEQNLKLCLHYLRCHGRIAIKENFKTEGEIELTTLIKFAKPNEKLEAINEIDLSIYTLEKNESALTNAVEQLENEKDAYILEAKSYLAKGRRQMAKNSLRKKREVEKRIEKRAGVLENVQVLLVRVKEAECDSKVVESYKKGVSALKNTFKEAGLSEANVSDVISDVQEVLDLHDDLQFTLSQPVSDNFDADLEEELAELLAANDNDDAGDVGVQNNESQDIKLPTPPRDDHADIERRLRALHVNLSPNSVTDEALKKEIAQ